MRLLSIVHYMYTCTICAVHIRICTHHECEVDKIETQTSPAYTSVAMTTPMGPQCEDGAPPKYMNVNI